VCVASAGAIDLIINETPGTVSPFARRTKQALRDEAWLAPSDSSSWTSVPFDA